MEMKINEKSLGKRDSKEIEAYRDAKRDVQQIRNQD